MPNNQILHKNYTTNTRLIQLKLPLNVEVLIPEDDSVRLLSQFVEEMDLGKLYETYSRIRENQATPRELLKIVIYGYMNGIYSSRPLETACKRDVNYMYLLNGKNAPDHTTIARFKSLHFALVSKEMLAEVTNKLFSLGEVSGKTIFIDGTKIEANANKYTFVWKKAITKHMTRKLEKAADFMAECEELYGIKLIYKNVVKIKHLKKLKKRLSKIKEDENITFVYGRGKRKSQLQRSIEELDSYLEKLKAYTKKLHTMGSRNSYSKTDEDATFMRMKEDYMRNGQLKPAYNLQHGVDSEYITWLSIEQLTTDVNTLKPFLREMEGYLSFKYKKIIADAGYESEENYNFIKNNKQIAYIKPANYEVSKTRTFKKDISRFENMDYDHKQDIYICKNNRKLKKAKVFIRKSRTGYKSEKTEYICEDCSHCSMKVECIKGKRWKIPLEKRTKRLEISKEFMRYRKENLERITSPEGIQLRINRSIQAEGSFAQIKQDMGFRRFLSRGKPNVLTESILLAIGHNIKKLHRKIQDDRLGQHLFSFEISA